MYQFKPTPGLLPVMPGARLYSVDTASFTIDNEELYAEGVVVTEDAILVLLDDEVYELGEGIFLSRDDALEWIEENRRPTPIEFFQGMLLKIRSRIYGADPCSTGRSA